MLSLFPIQFLALFAYFILRIFLGILLFHLGNKVLFTTPRPKGWIVFSVSSMAIGLLLLIGMLTQLATILAILLSITILCIKKTSLGAILPDRYFWILVIGAALSLTITGAGVFAVDLPI